MMSMRMIRAHIGGTMYKTNLAASSLHGLPYTAIKDKTTMQNKANQVYKN